MTTTKNMLRLRQVRQPCAFVIFGASGNLIIDILDTREEALAAFAQE